jgi:L-ribulose-5-phosphate 3-epimerase UlaE
MQGRLLPKYKGRYQAHPVDYWQDEFFIAEKIGLDCIEFILDFNDAECNPLLKEGGIEEILNVMKKTGVSVKTVCADYFMEAPLHNRNKNIAIDSLSILSRLIDNSIKLGINDIVIPCVDQSTLSGIEEVNLFVEQISKIIPVIEEKKINLSLETDLAPQPFAELLEKLNSDNITVNYDIGNSAALGFNPVEELQAYGTKITDIHIKDRILGGGPVILGEGNANFKYFFDALKPFNYQGPFIMQAYRDSEGVEIFEKQLFWIKPYIETLFR